MEVWNYRVSYLEHHGIKGQKWGLRRYQNPDGTLTDLGRKRIEKTTKKISKMYDTMTRKADKRAENAARKGKSGKEKTWKYIAEDNRAAKKARLEKIGNMTYAEFKKTRNKDRFRSIFTQPNMGRNSDAIMFTTPYSRVQERIAQWSNRYISTFTFDKVLDTMSGKQGALYLDNKRRMAQSTTAYSY